MAEPRRAEAADSHGISGSKIGIDRMNGCLDGFTFEEVWTEFNRKMAFNIGQDVAIENPGLDLVLGADSNSSLGFIQQVFFGILLVLAVAAQTARHEREMGSGG